MPDGLTSPRRSLQAERQRRRRQRARRGEIIVPTPICGSIIDSLIALRWLDERQAASRDAIGIAISRMLSDLAHHKL